MKKHSSREEILAQAEAFRRMTGDEMELIREHAADFREIITEFERQHGRVPTADDLLWILSERNGRDITRN
jgi:hypothetical protein